jgi:hypothetical protein
VSIARVVKARPNSVLRKKKHTYNCCEEIFYKVTTYNTQTKMDTHIRNNLQSENFGNLDAIKQAEDRNI